MKQIMETMDLAAKKLAFIEEYIHLSNEKLIDKLDSLLRKEKEQDTPKKTLFDFFGIMTEEEGEEFMKNINDGCENVDYNE